MAVTLKPLHPIYGNGIDRDLASLTLTLTLTLTRYGPLWPARR